MANHGFNHATHTVYCFHKSMWWLWLMLTCAIMVVVGANLYDTWLILNQTLNQLGRSMFSVPCFRSQHEFNDWKDTQAMCPTIFVPHSVFSGDFGLIRIDALSRFWANPELGFGTLESRHEKLLAGLYNDAVAWTFVVLGDPSGISVYLGLPGGQDRLDMWAPTLSAVLPGCELSAERSVGQMVGALTRLPWGAAMTGNPSSSIARAKSHGEKPAPQATLEPFFRTMEGGDWAYLVLGRPVSQDEIQQTLAGLAYEERELVSAHLRRGSAEENNNPQAKRVPRSCSGHPAGSTNPAVAKECGTYVPFCLPVSATAYCSGPRPC